MTDIVKLYNPANAAALTPDELQGLQKLDSAQIKELATAYPNVTMQRAFLLIIDSRKPAEKQLPALSSFENLWNLREKNGLRHYVAFAFRNNYKAPSSKNATSVRAKKSEVVDLSETELRNLPGFKTQNREEPPQQVNVTKIHKTTVGFIVDPVQTTAEETELLIKAADALNVIKIKKERTIDEIEKSLDTSDGKFGQSYPGGIVNNKKEAIKITDKPKGKPGPKPKNKN